MTKIQAVSRLIRLPNLIMVVLTMYLMRWSVIRPILDLLGFDPEMPEWSFALLVLSTLFITAAGNVINDFHDVKADRVNHPDRVVIDRFISRRQAILTHFTLNIIGVLLGILIAFYHRIEWLFLVFLVVPGLLWLYSLSLKNMALIGNLVVSLLTGTVPLLVLMFEYPLLIHAHQDILQNEPDLFKPILYWIAAFALFAFLTNLIRELVKDAQDIPGDLEAGSQTLAIRIGIKSLKRLVFVITILTLAVLGYIFFYYLPDWISLVYFVVFLAIPFILVLYKLIRARESQDFKPISYLAKLIMFFGILYAPVAYYIMHSFIR